MGYTGHMMRFVIVRTFWALTFAMLCLWAVVWSAQHQMHNVPDYPSIGQDVSIVTPHWTKARFPNCHAIHKGDLADEVVVVNHAGKRFREQTDAVWSLNSDLSKNNDLSVIGVCY